MGHDGFDDDLPAWHAPIPSAPRPGRRPPRRWRLGRVPTVAVVLLLIATGSLQLSLDDYARSLVRDPRTEAIEEAAPVVNTLPETGGYGAVDPPSPSGAWPPYPLNHSFAGDLLTLGAPTNVGAEIDKATDAATYPLSDALGTVRAKTSGATGAVTATADFDPWGVVRSTTGGAPALGWTGEQGDAATGLTHLRARDYDPLRGQFLSRDTVQPNGPGTQGYSAYAYTAGNPVSRTDPSGHDLASAAVWAGLLGTLYVAYQGLFSAYKALDFMPEAARGLVRGLLLLGISVLRQMFVTAIVNFTVEAIAGKTGIDSLGVGKALLTLGVMQLFAANRAETRACVAASWRACVGIFQMMPLLPAAQCLAAAALFVEDYGHLFSGAPATTEEGVYAGADTLGLVGDCAGFDVSGLGGGGGPGPTGGGPGKAPDGNGGGPGRGGCNSFPAGTGVLLADGSAEPIEGIEPGELVWAEDPMTGEAGARAVTDAWGQVDGPLVTVYTIDHRGKVGELGATEDHPVWSDTDGAWEEAGELGAGEALRGADGRAVTVLRVEAAGAEAVVYDLTVADLSTFYVAVGDGWVLVHNAGSCDPVGGNSPKGRVTHLPDPLASQVDEAIDRARQGTVRFPSHDGKEYQNWDGRIPIKPAGYYTEWTVAAKNAPRGMDRVILGGDPTNPDVIYYWDHLRDPVLVGP